MARPKKAPRSPWRSFVDGIQTKYDITQLVRAFQDPGQRDRILKELAGVEDAKALRVLWYWQDRSEAHRKAGLTEKSAAGEATRDASKEFGGVSSTYIQRLKREAEVWVRESEDFVTKHVDPVLDHYATVFRILEAAFALMRDDTLYHNLLQPDAPWGPGMSPGQGMPGSRPSTRPQAHTYAEAFLLAHQARQAAESRVSELESEVKKLNTIRGEIGLSASANSGKGK